MCYLFLFLRNKWNKNLKRAFLLIRRLQYVKVEKYYLSCLIVWVDMANAEGQCRATTLPALELLPLSKTGEDRTKWWRVWDYVAPLAIWYPHAVPAALLSACCVVPINLSDSAVGQSDDVAPPLHTGHSDDSLSSLLPPSAT